MSLTSDQKVARYRNLLIALAQQAIAVRASASNLMEHAKRESHPGKRAGLRTLVHCSNRHAQTLERLLARNRAALRDFFGTAKVEEVADEKIILHKL